METKSRTTAAWLALLLGGFGVYKFYLNQYVQGGIMLCLTLFSGGTLWIIVQLWAFIDAIRFFSMDNNKFYEQYCQQTTQQSHSPAETNVHVEHKDIISKETPAISNITSSLSSTAFCSQCGAPIDSDSVFCPKCGAPVSAPKKDEIKKTEVETINCPNCGASVLSTFTTCPYCRTKLE